MPTLLSRRRRPPRDPAPGRPLRRRRRVRARRGRSTTRRARASRALQPERAAAADRAGSAVSHRLLRHRPNELAYLAQLGGVYRAVRRRDAAASRRAPAPRWSMPEPCGFSSVTGCRSTRSSRRMTASLNQPARAPAAGRDRTRCCRRVARRRRRGGGASRTPSPAVDPTLAGAVDTTRRSDAATP